MSPKMGRPPGRKDSPGIQRPTAPPATRSALSEQWRPPVGLPSAVIRTHGQRRPLAWWQRLDPAQRAAWLDWLYAHHGGISLDAAPAEDWE